MPGRGPMVRPMCSWFKFSVVSLSAFVLSGCDTGIPLLGRSADQNDVVEATDVTGDDTVIRPKSRPEAGATMAAPMPAPMPASSGPVLGTTIASLGDPARGGYWLETPLVTQEQAGSVQYQGGAIAVTLIPTGGARTSASRLSLAAMQALGAPLTDLVEVVVIRG